MGGTVRHDLLELLRGEPQSARGLSRALGIAEREVLDHLSHIQRSLARSHETLVVEPASCLVCGYTFRQRTRLSRPTRCPECRSTHLSAPRYCIRPKA